MTGRASTAFVVIVAGCVLLSPGCRRNDTDAAAPHSVGYVLEWKRSKVEGPAGDAGWEVTNDLGYRVHVSRGYLVARSLELIPCNPVPPVVSLLQDVGDFLVRPAYAGHSAIADPSATQHAEVESLLNPQSRATPVRYPGAQQYCQAHYLVARADNAANGLPAEVDMVDQTLRVEGWFRRAGDSAQVPFTIATAVANGRLFELPRSPSDPSCALNTASVSGVVVVRRNLDAIFDHVDFSTMAAPRVAREVLQNLVNGTEIELRVQHDG